MASQCPQCGAPLLVQRMQGLCPRCVARQAARMLAGHDACSPAGPDSILTVLAQSRTFGDYELIEELARGGMGVIFRARQISLNRPVALKMILEGHLATPSLRRRFQTEAEAAARLDHPHIVPIYEIGEHEGRHYFSMRLIEGATLADWSTTSEPRNRDVLVKVAELLSTTARALHYAHQRGVLHRDLKPTNILLDRQGEPHITDFGLAKLAEDDSSLTLSTAVLGTPAYMSPEQAAGRTRGLTTAADTYSLGAILYELLTGRPPFRAESVVETLRHVCEREPTRPSTLNPAVDRDLETVCLKCLSKDPKWRYGSAEWLAEDLDRWRKGEPVLARPGTTWERTVRWIRRNPTIAALATGFLLAVGSGLVGTGFMWNRARETASSGEKLLYVANMKSAQAAWEGHNVGLVRQLLEESQGSPLRGFEWYYWQRLTHLEQRTFRGHLDGVFGSAVSPDGQRIVSGGADRTARVWELATGQELLTLKGHTDLVFAVTFSSDGRRILTGSFDKTARVWDAVDGRERLRLEGHTDNVETVAFSADDRWILTGSPDKTVRLWNAATGIEHKRIPGHLAALSPDGRQMIVTGGFVMAGGTLKENEASRVASLWDVESSRELLQFKGHSEAILSVDFSPDGRRILTGSRDNSAKVWDAATGVNLVTLRGHRLQVEPARFSPDGTRIVTASEDQTAKIWDSMTGSNLVTLKGHTAGLMSATFTPDGQQIVTGSQDGTLKVWNPYSTRERMTLDGGRSKLAGLAFSYDGKRLVTGSHDGVAKVWNAETGSERFAISGRLVRYSPDGRQIATSHGWMKEAWIRLWESENGRELHVLHGHEDTIQCLAFSPDSQRLASASDDRTAIVWDVSGGKALFKLLGHKDGLRGVAFSPDGRWIVTGSVDGTVRVWDGTTGAEWIRFTEHGAALGAVTFAPDGRRILSGDENGTMLIWEMATKRVLLRLKGHTSWVFSASFSPDGQRILSGSWDQTARLWETLSGREVLTFRAHQGAVMAAGFSPDGRRIATASHDGLAMLWDVATPEQARTWLKEESAAARKIEVYRRDRLAERSEEQRH